VVVVLVAVIVLLKFVGSGSNGVSIPSVQNDTVAQATSALTGSGFHVGSTVDQASAAINKGLVINTIPGYGGSAPRGSTIKLIVSTGAPAAKTVTVPYVVGKTKEEAQQMLAAAGFQVQVQVQQQAGTPPNQVFNETPNGNSQAPKGSVVTIQVTPTGQTVPGDVIGKSQAEAQNELSGPPYGYNVQTTFVNGPGQPGTVTQIQPGPGTPLAPGSSVTIFVIQPQPSPTPSPSDTSSPSPSPTSGGH
jgi:serine/threonine-protein kinase